MDHCYTTLEDAYCSVPCATLGLSDHSPVHLILTHRQKLKSVKPVVKIVKRWTDETKLELQACFDCTDWSVFEAGATDLDDLTDTLTPYISFCEDMWVLAKTFCTYNNNKPWFTAKVRQLLQAKEEAYRSGDRNLVQPGQKHTDTGDQSSKKRSWRPECVLLQVW